MLITTIDVGGTFIKFALMNEHSEIIERGKIPTPMTGRDDFIAAIEKIYRSFENTAGIAISMPGIIDAINGVCITSGALEYNNGFHIVDTLQSMCNTRITVDNDAKCAALAEATVGALADVDSGFVMIFGTAIGGAFVKDRKVLRGAHFSAGEVSFTITDLDGAPEEEYFLGFRCGVPQLLDSYAREKNIPVEEITGEKFFDAVAKNDPIADKCLERFTRRIAVEIFNLQMLFDPQRFAIGGGISAQPIFIDRIISNLEKLRADCRFDLPHPTVVACKFRNDANLIGALQQFIAHSF